MPDISALYTTQSKPGFPAQGPAGSPSTLADAPGGAGVNLNFFDMIFALTKGTAADQLTALQSPVDPEFPVETDSNAPSDILLPETAPAVELDSAGQKKLMSVLESLLRGMPANQQHIVLKIIPGQMKQAAEALNITLSKNGANADSGNLIATGLTPEQLTALINRIAVGKDADVDATTQALLVSLVKIMPDGSKNEAIFLPRALIVSKPATTGIPEGDEPNDELAASLNALTLPLVSPETTPVAAHVSRSVLSTPVNEGLCDDVLKIPEQIQTKGAAELKAIVPSPGPDAAMTAAPTPPGPLNSTLGSSFANMFGGMMSTSSLNDVFPEGLDWSQNSISGLCNTQVTGTAQLSSLVTQASHASQPHSATQIVAASLIRSAQSGENQTLQLKLNPPELGRIEVHMHFTKDKTMKAHMVIEKPETMLMLQRDAQVLERALQEAGMDSGGGNLSFELSSGKNDFFNDRNGNGHTDAGHTGTDDDGVEVIETTMTWYIDADTGHQRYNILA